MAKKVKDPKQPKEPKPPKPTHLDQSFELGQPYDLSLALRDGEDPAAPIDVRSYRVRIEQRNDGGVMDTARLKGTLIEIEDALDAIEALIRAERAKDVPPMTGEVG